MTEEIFLTASKILRALEKPSNSPNGSQYWQVPVLPEINLARCRRSGPLRPALGEGAR